MNVVKTLFQGRHSTFKITATQSLLDNRPILTSANKLLYEMRLRTLFVRHWKHCFSDNNSVLIAADVLTTMRHIN